MRNKDELTLTAKLILAIIKYPSLFTKLMMDKYKASKATKPLPKHDPLVMRVIRDTTTPKPTFNTIHQQLVNHGKHPDPNYPSSFQT